MDKGYINFISFARGIQNGFKSDNFPLLDESEVEKEYDRVLSWFSFSFDVERDILNQYKNGEIDKWDAIEQLEDECNLSYDEAYQKVHSIFNSLSPIFSMTHGREESVPDYVVERFRGAFYDGWLGENKDVQDGSVFARYIDGDDEDGVSFRFYFLFGRDKSMSVGESPSGEAFKFKALFVEHGGKYYGKKFKDSDFNNVETAMFRKKLGVIQELGLEPVKGASPLTYVTSSGLFSGRYSPSVVDAPAYWINPFGKILPVYNTHIDTIFDCPEAFGLSKKYVKELYDSCGEAYRIEGKARDDLVYDIVKNRNWIRIRYIPTEDVYHIELRGLDNSRKDYLWQWASDLIKADAGKSSSGVLISKVGERYASVEGTLQELVNFSLFSSFGMGFNFLIPIKSVKDFFSTKLIAAAYNKPARRKRSKYHGALVNNTFDDAPGGISTASPASASSSIQTHPSIRYLVVSHLMHHSRRHLVKSSLSGTLDTFLLQNYCAGLGSDDPGNNIKHTGDNGRVVLSFKTDSGHSTEVDLGGGLGTGYVVAQIEDELGLFPEGTVVGDLIDNAVIQEIVRSQGERDGGITSGFIKSEITQDDSVLSDFGVVEAFSNFAASVREFHRLLERYFQYFKGGVFQSSGQEAFNNKVLARECLKDIENCIVRVKGDYDRLRKRILSGVVYSDEEIKESNPNIEDIVGTWFYVRDCFHRVSSPDAVLVKAYHDLHQILIAFDSVINEYNAGAGEGHRLCTIPQAISIFKRNVSKLNDKHGFSV